MLLTEWVKQIGKMAKCESLNDKKKPKLINFVCFSGKAACDRMAADCGFELKKRGVAMVSLWPGPVKTEYIQVIAS